jgi:glycosyltransferase involved in cell wall biosynthesis
VAVGPSGPPEARRDIAAITYAANPAKKGLDCVLAAWRRLRIEWPQARSHELLVAGTGPAELAAAGLGHEDGAGVRFVGALPRERYRALLRRARVFVCAPRREDYGVAQLEALADGCMLVTNAAPGPYAALALARELDGRLVGDDLAGAMRAALEQPREDYPERARGLLEPFGAAALDELVAGRLLARLLA